MSSLVGEADMVEGKKREGGAERQRGKVGKGNGAMGFKPISR